MEIEIKLKTFKYKMMCDKCKKGEMLPTGMALASNPPQYQHKCTVCGNMSTYNTIYPRIEYQEEEE